MTKKEAFDLLGVSERTFDGYVKKYGLTVQYVPGKTGRRADYAPDELERLKEQLAAPQSTVTGLSAPSMDGGDGALMIAPQSGVAVPLRPSASNGNVPSFIAISPEHLPALASALMAQPGAVPIEQRLTLDLDGAAALSGLSRGLVRDAIAKGELKAAKIGRGWKIERGALDVWVKSLFEKGAE